MRPGAAVVIGVVGALAAPAAAQTAVATRPAFSVERLVPAPAAGTWIGLEPADVLPAGRWAVTITSSVMQRPIVLRDVQTGAEESVPVLTRWGNEVVAARGLGARYLVGAALPLVWQTGDRLQGIGLDDRALARYALGDLRLHGRARVAGRPGDRGLGAAFAASVVLPTGDDDHFAGEAGWMLSWGARVGWRGERWELVGGAALRLRTTEVILLSPARPHGNELTASAGVAARVDPLGDVFGGPDRAWLVGEVEGTLGDAPGTGSRGPSPAEVRVAARVQVHHCWSVAVGGGGGVTPDEIGSPAWRGFVQVSFDQAPPRDLDGDGVLDGKDACWRVPEDRDGFQDADGCPDRDDDGDGVEDASDACPREREDVDGYRDADGCPDAETRLPNATDLMGPED